MKLKINLSLITDKDLNKALEIIQSSLNEQTFLKGDFNHYEIVIPAAISNFKYPHNLGFLPKDVLLTSVIGVTPTFNYTLFDSTYLNITTAGASTFRAFVGRYTET